MEPYKQTFLAKLELLGIEYLQASVAKVAVK